MNIEKDETEVTLIFRALDNLTQRVKDVEERLSNIEKKANRK